MSFPLTASGTLQVPLHACRSSDAAVATMWASDQAPESLWPEGIPLVAELLPAEQTALQSLVDEFRDVFSKTYRPPSPDAKVFHTIETGDASPVAGRNFRRSPREAEVVEDLVNDMEKQRSGCAILQPVELGSCACTKEGWELAVLYRLQTTERGDKEGYAAYSTD